MTAATPVPSPCTGVCTIDAASGWCAGCLRSLDEIAAWGALDEAAKARVWRQLPARRARAAAAGSIGADADADAAPRQPP